MTGLRVVEAGEGPEPSLDSTARLCDDFGDLRDGRACPGRRLASGALVVCDSPLHEYDRRPW